MSDAQCVVLSLLKMHVADVTIGFVKNIYLDIDDVKREDKWHNVVNIQKDVTV